LPTGGIAAAACALRGSPAPLIAARRGQEHRLAPALLQPWCSSMISATAPVGRAAAGDGEMLGSGRGPWAI
jgi:hypothetical protein